MGSINPSGRETQVLLVEQMHYACLLWVWVQQPQKQSCPAFGVCVDGSSGNSCLSLMHKSCSLVSKQELEKWDAFKASHKLGCEIWRGSSLSLAQE